jgi:Kef-type K+ transport system membrane component KefB
MFVALQAAVADFSTRQWLTDLPLLARTTMGLCLFLLVPSISKRFGVPGVVGLVVFGVLVGPSVLDLIPADHTVLDFLSEVGKLLVLFFAGMEIDLRQFRRTGPRAVAFDLLWKLGQLTVYAAVVIGIVSWLARLPLATGRADRDMQMLILLVTVTVTSTAAELIHLEPIVGAFLAGVAVSSVMLSSDAKEHIVVLGNTLFVPAFFLLIVLNIDARQAAVAIAEDWPLVTGQLVSRLLAKFVAAWLAGWLCKYGTAERLMMWSLSLPQVAATLAAALGPLLTGRLVARVQGAGPPGSAPPVAPPRDPPHA